MDVPLFKDVYDGPKFDFLLSHAAYCRDVLKLKKGQMAVVSNGRVSLGLASPSRKNLHEKSGSISLYLWIKHLTVALRSNTLLCFFIPDYRSAGGRRSVQPGWLPAFGEHHPENIWGANQKQSPTVRRRGGQVFYLRDFLMRFDLEVTFLDSRGVEMNLNAGFLSGPATSWWRWTRCSPLSPKERPG